MGKLKLCVGGIKFLTTEDTLRRYPETRLARLKISSEYYDKTAGEYVFDRDSVVFSSILNLYRTSELHLPSNVCGKAIRRELEFWQISEKMISDCCWKAMYQADEDSKIIDTLRLKIEDKGTIPANSSYYQKLKHRLWMILDRPNSSRAARIWSCFYMTLVCTSALTYCLGTVPELRSFENIEDYQTYVNMTRNGDGLNAKITLLLNSDISVIILIIDFICLIVFTLEACLHWLASPEKGKFFKSFLNWIDIITVLIGWVSFSFERVAETGILSPTKQAVTSYLFIKGLYLLRLFRFVRFSERFAGLKVMILAVKRSKQELCLLIFSIIILATIFGSFEYYCEFHNNKFDSIPISIWWAIVTMTTVGYGDHIPTGTCGYCVGTLCSLCGLLVLTMPIAVIAANFNAFYVRNKYRETKTIE